MPQAEQSDDQTKAFISYAWSSPEHKAWVRRLAERITEDGTYTILDEWDLRPGADPLYFMEQSITDPQVKKVLIICDRTYKEKADSRSGGVGTETQILTPEIYRKADQSKYAALVTEVDDEGKAYVPTFYGGRIFIDFSDPDREEEAYEELTRWINDAPLHQRPKLGKKPAYLGSEEAKPLATESRFKRAKEALDRDAAGAPGLVRDFGSGVMEQLIALRPDGSSQRANDLAFNDAIVSAADTMRPYVQQFHAITRSVARSGATAFDDLLSLLEQVLATTERDRGTTSWTPSAYEANKMMAYEAFLGFVASLLVERRIDLISRALEYAYYFDDPNTGRGRSTKDYTEFNQYVETLRFRNQLKGDNRADWQADFINKHYSSGWLNMSRMMEADLLLYSRAYLLKDEAVGMWFPHTLIYSGRWGSALELFARMESQKYFEQVSEALFRGITVATLKERLAPAQSERLWDRVYPGPSIGSLLGLEQIGVRR